MDFNKSPDEIFKETKHYCPLLWNHLHVNTLGDVTPCCMAPFGSSLGNLKDQSLDEIWNGASMKEARLKLLNDEPLLTCNGCYEKEKTGNNWSLRKASITKYHESVIPLLETTQLDGASLNSKPTYWDIRFSNICNMRCRMCGHFSSSKWYADAKRLSEDYDNHRYLGPGNKAIIKAVDDSNILLSRLDEYLPYVQELYFAGGEPMIMEDHYRILKRLDELKLYNTFLRYNTNFLQLAYKDKDIVELWKKFTNVFCSISVDTFGNRAEILRHDTNWKTIERNVARVKKETPDVRFNIAPTIQILNVLSITKLHKEWIKKGWLGPNDMFLNILHTPDFYNIQALPKHLKQEAKQKFDDHLLWLSENFNENLYSVRNTINNAINYMMDTQLDESHLYEMCKQTKQLDTIRNQNTPATFPELKYIWSNYAETD